MCICVGRIMKPLDRRPRGQGRLRLVNPVSREHVYPTARGIYFREFNPLLFAGLSLPQTKSRPKHIEGVVCVKLGSSLNVAHAHALYDLNCEFYRHLLELSDILGGLIVTSHQSRL